MSTPTQASLFGADPARGVPRQRTRVKIIINSHIDASPPVGTNRAGVINCSDDCIALNTSKTIKGGGGANFTLVPRHNYINYIYPNDWVNIWINVGDGRGWIRVFFGFVDRVERSIQTTDPGTTTTLYNVTCTDFTKAFDITQIYFNPHIANRKDFLGNFAGTKNLAGAQLRTKGIAAFGGPADIVMNFAHLLMGFGSQFMAPPSYPFENALMEESRRWRRNWAKSRLSDELRKQIGGDTIKKWLDDLYADAKPLEDALKAGTASGLSSSKYFDQGELEDLQEDFRRAGNAGAIIRRIAISILLVKKGLKKDAIYDPEIKTGLAIEETAFGPGHLLDLIDFSFIEYAAIDGSIVSAPIWTQQGSLWSLMQSYSNDPINELFLDLRPLGENDKEFALAEGGYKKQPDEFHSDKDERSVRFVPAMVMREYPFSTITGVNTENIEILGQRGKKVVFGAIFSKKPNVPGRKVIEIDTLNDYISSQKVGSKAWKHLDVAVINITDIISETIGRSDADVVNLMEMYSDGFMGKHMKFAMKDVQPIPIPISVARHGLRVRTYTTRFARFSKKMSSIAGVDNFRTRNKLLRWIMMLDHWYQHNIEYLNGTITTRAFPEIRVGYRLDIEERNESYYVEGVNHTWSYPEGMTSSFTLSRGQRNDPFPVYEKIALPTFGGDRKLVSRLADSFRQKDPSAVLRAVNGEPSFSMKGETGNLEDDPTLHSWGAAPETYLAANSDEPFMSEVAETFKKVESIGELFDPGWENKQDVPDPVPGSLVKKGNLNSKRIERLSGRYKKSLISGGTGRGNKK
jgi:hypothetical protein